MKTVALAALLLAALPARADDRMKVDLLLVVAHPDDETLVAGYLARAVKEQGKRVAVVFCTRGDAGGNSAGPERAHALGTVREIEGRRALARLGIDLVWFLDGRDTASQSVLRSLGSWPHGAVLEALVRIVRLTRPEVVLTWLPASVAGENHGDHQAAGVIATEAFDLAGSAVAFPAQLAGAERTFENALDGLRPWQAKKLYVYSDAYDASFLRGPSYALAPYLRQVLDELAPYHSQSPDPRMNVAIERGEHLDEIAKQATGGDEPFLPDPIRFGLARSLVAAKPTGDVFDGIAPGPIAFAAPKPVAEPAPTVPALELDGLWGFHRRFRRAHGLDALEPRPNEIAIRTGETLTMPLVAINPTAAPLTMALAATVPPGWTQKPLAPSVTVPAHDRVALALVVTAPAEERKSFGTIRVTATPGGSVSLSVQVRKSTLPQP